MKKWRELAKATRAEAEGDEEMRRHSSSQSLRLGGQLAVGCREKKDRGEAVPVAPWPISLTFLLNYKTNNPP